MENHEIDTVVASLNETVKQPKTFAELKSDGVRIAGFIPLEIGLHQFKITGINTELSPQVKKLKLYYIGSVINSKGVEQQAKISENLDTEDGITFAISRATKLLSKFNQPFDPLNQVVSPETIPSGLTELLGKTFTIEKSSKKVGKVKINEINFVID